MEQQKKIVSNNARQKREKLGMTQEAMAILFGVSRSAINMQEQGKRMPPLISTAFLDQVLLSLDLPATFSPDAELQKEIDDAVRKVRAELSAALENLKKDLILARKELSGMKKDYDEASESFARVTHLLTLAAADKGAKMVLSAQQMLSKRRLLKTIPQNQKLLELKVKDLENKITRYQVAMDELQ